MVNESLEIQTINYQNLKSNTIEIQNSEIELLDNACRNLGFFNLVNHGLEDQITQLFDFAETFFSLHKKRKKKFPARKDTVMSQILGKHLICEERQVKQNLSIWV